MVYVFLANGFETVEALACVDVLRRAGIETVTVGIESKTINSSQNIKVICDKAEDEISVLDDVEGIVLPGGMPGTKNLDKSVVVNTFIDFAIENGLLVAAICAAPSVLGKRGLLSGKKAT